MNASDEPSLGLLADDLTDIYLNLKEGLSFADQGETGMACLSWSFSYRTHWGRHAANALMAIEIYRIDRWIELPDGE